MQNGIIVLIIIAVVVITFDIFIIHRIYKKNTSALKTNQGAIQIQPKRSSFIVSWFILFVAVSIPQLIIIWFLPIGRDFFASLWFLIPTIVILNYFIAHPYYTVVLHGGKIHGATLWGWGWNRTEINANEINVEKVLKQRFSRSLKITILESVSGTKILTLGLDDFQIKQILEYQNEGQFIIAGYV